MTARHWGYYARQICESLPGVKSPVLLSIASTEITLWRRPSVPSWKVKTNGSLKPSMEPPTRMVWVRLDTPKKSLP
eukprot:1076745-Lingulodinium_polyedra.AAC.1